MIETPIENCQKILRKIRTESIERILCRTVPRALHLMNVLEIIENVIEKEDTMRKTDDRDMMIEMQEGDLTTETEEETVKIRPEKQGLP